MKEKELHDGDELGKTLAQIAVAIDSLAFAVAGQRSIDAAKLARQLKAEAKRLTGSDLAKEIVLRMEKSVQSVAKKRGRGSRGRKS